MVALHQWRSSSVHTSNVCIHIYKHIHTYIYICIFLLTCSRGRKIKLCINYCLMGDVVIAKPEEMHPDVDRIKAALYLSTHVKAFSWWSYWICGVSWSPEVRKLNFQCACVSCCNWLACVVMDYAKVQPARKPSFASPRSPVSPPVEKTLTEKGITLLIEVRFAIGILVQEFPMLSVDSLLSVFKRHSCTHSLLP